MISTKNTWGKENGLLYCRLIISLVFQAQINVSWCCCIVLLLYQNGGGGVATLLPSMRKCMWESWLLLSCSIKLRRWLLRSLWVLLILRWFGKLLWRKVSTLSKPFVLFLHISNTLTEWRVSSVSCPVGHFLHLVKLCFLSVFWQYVMLSVSAFSQTSVISPFLLNGDEAHQSKLLTQQVKMPLYECFLYYYPLS